MGGTLYPSARSRWRGQVPADQHTALAHRDGDVRGLAGVEQGGHLHRRHAFRLGRELADRGVHVHDPAVVAE